MSTRHKIWQFCWLCKTNIDIMCRKCNCLSARELVNSYNGHFIHRWFVLLKKCPPTYLRIIHPNKYFNQQYIVHFIHKQFVHKNCVTYTFLKGNWVSVNMNFWLQSHKIVGFSLYHSMFNFFLYSKCTKRTGRSKIKLEYIFIHIRLIYLWYILLDVFVTVCLKESYNFHVIRYCELL